jgi:hypothetical protein
LRQRPERTEKLRHTGTNFTRVLLDPVVQQENVGIQEMADIPEFSLQAIIGEEFSDKSGVRTPVKVGPFGDSGHAIEKFGRASERVDAGSTGSDEGAVDVEQYQSGHGEKRGRCDTQVGRESAQTTCFDVGPKGF